jgi:hypothetical protein
VLTDVTTDMVITKEETFGHVAPLYRFKSKADAVEMANDTPTLSSPACGGGKGGGSPPISTAAISAATGGSPKPSSTASSASTRASSRPSPVARSPASAVATAAYRLSRWRARSSDRLFPHLDADLIPDDPQCIF